MRRIVGALAASAVLFGGLAAAVQGRAPAAAEILPVPPVGEVRAAALADGSPVFVVRHAADEVSVLDAVSTHLAHLVAWCPEGGVFVEPLGATRYDRWGRWLGGPAPTGLAPYAAALRDDGTTVAVGARQDLPARWVTARPDPAYSKRTSDTLCHEGSTGRFPPGTDPADALDVADLDTVPAGHFAVVRGLIDTVSEPPRLCAPPADGSRRCPDGVVRVWSFYWDAQWPLPPSRPEDWLEGEFLVRVGADGDVRDVVALNRLLADGRSYSLRSGWPTRGEQPWVEVGVLLDAATVTRREVVLHIVGEPVAATGSEPPLPLASVTPPPLRRGVWWAGGYDDRARLRSPAGSPYLSPDQVAEVVNGSREPVPALFTVRDGQLGNWIQLIDDAWARQIGLEPRRAAED